MTVRISLGLFRISKSCKHKLIYSRLLVVCYSFYTVWLQISMIEYFRDFCEFGYDHENFCYETFLTAASSTALDTSKSRKTSESRKSGKIRKFKTTEIWSHTV